MEKLPASPGLATGQTLPQGGSGAAALGRPKKLRPVVTHWIGPRRSGLKGPESTSNRCSLRKQMTTDACRLMRLKAVAQRSTASWRLGTATAQWSSASAGQPHRGWPYEDLSRMKGNFHVRFLGGCGRATARAYPAHLKATLGRRKNEECRMQPPRATTKRKQKG